MAIKFEDLKAFWQYLNAPTEDPKLSSMKNLVKEGLIRFLQDLSTGKGKQSYENIFAERIKILHSFQDRQCSTEMLAFMNDLRDAIINDRDQIKKIIDKETEYGGDIIELLGVIPEQKIAQPLPDFKFMKSGTSSADFLTRSYSLTNETPSQSAQVLISQAGFLALDRDFQKSEARYRQAIAFYETGDSKISYEHGHARLCLACTLADQGKFQEAWPLFEDARKIIVEVNNSELTNLYYSQLAFYRAKEGAIYFSKENYELAWDSYFKAFDFGKLNPAPNQVDLYNQAMDCINLGKCNMKLLRFGSAATDFENGLGILIKLQQAQSLAKEIDPNELNRHTIVAQLDRCDALIRSRKFTEATVLYNDILTNVNPATIPQQYQDEYNSRKENVLQQLKVIELHEDFDRAKKYANLCLYDQKTKGYKFGLWGYGNPEYYTKTELAALTKSVAALREAKLHDGTVRRVDETFKLAMRDPRANEMLLKSAPDLHKELSTGSEFSAIASKTKTEQKNDQIDVNLKP